MQPAPLSNCPGVAESVHWLYRIQGLPIVLDTPTCRHYAAMKLGDPEGARLFARRLAPMAETLIDSLPLQTRWVLTAPPIRNIPSGANVICWHLYRHLRDVVTNPDRLRQLDIKAAGDKPKRSRHRQPYSAMDFEQRKFSRRHEPAPRLAAGDLAGRAVVVVNDICVTGAQQLTMRDRLAPHGPLAIYWLYVVHTDPELGRRNPQLEDGLNHSAYLDENSFGELLAVDDMQFTGKCLVRLFALDESGFRRALRRLDRKALARLARLVRLEGHLGSRAFDLKLQILLQSLENRNAACS